MENETQSHQINLDQKDIINNACSICRAMKKRSCTGHGGGGGGGKSSAEHDESTKKLLESTAKYDPLGTYPYVLELLPSIADPELFDHSKASDLLFYINKEFTLTFRGNSNLSPEKLKKLFDEIIDQFEQFKEQFKAEFLTRGIYIENFKVERSVHELNIYIPNADAFEKFIEHLANTKFISHALLQQYRDATSIPFETFEEVVAVTDEDEEEAQYILRA